MPLLEIRERDTREILEEYYRNTRERYERDTIKRQMKLQLLAFHRVTTEVEQTRVSKMELEEAGESQREIKRAKRK